MLPTGCLINRHYPKYGEASAQSAANRNGRGASTKQCDPRIIVHRLQDEEKERTRNNFFLRWKAKSRSACSLAGLRVEYALLPASVEGMNRYISLDINICPTDGKEISNVRIEVWCFRG